MPDVPGVLHERAVEKALELLGPGASTKGFMRAVKDALIESWHQDTAPEACSFDDQGVDDWYGPLPRLIPDAYRIVSPAPQNPKPPFFLIDVVEVDGTSCLRSKIERWASLGSICDYDDFAFMRLRIFNEHFFQIGEYDENALMNIWTAIQYSSPPRRLRQCPAP